MELILQHFDALKRIGPIDQMWVGEKLFSYAKSVISQSSCQFDQLPEKSVTRGDLFKMVSSDSVNTLTCCVAIFAWGGMRRDHARSVLKASEYWIPITDMIRTQNIGRAEAYSEFSLMRAKGHLKGMGPAFFTKLIYFFGERTTSHGYIMDQWTARSANLLLGRQLIHVVKNKKNQARVSDQNSQHVYEEFCQFIETLASELNVSSDSAEEMIFSSGNSGRKQTRGEWRDYVLKHT
jgi:hypothetical protein